MAKLQFIKSFNKYEIAGKDVFIIGETHIPNDSKPNKELQTVPEFLRDRAKNGCDIYIEAEPEFRKIKPFKINSYNIHHTLKLIGDYNKLYGGDYRRYYLPVGFQNDLYNAPHKLKIHKGFLIQILQKVLKDMSDWKRHPKWQVYTEMTPKFMKTLNQVVSATNALINDLSKKRETYMDDMGNYEQIITFVRYLFMLIGDFFLMRDIIERDDAKCVFLLIGENHAQSFKNLL